MKRGFLAVVVGFCLVLFLGCSKSEESGEAAPGEWEEPSSMSYTLEIISDDGETMQFEYNMDGGKASYIVRNKQGGKFVTSMWMLQDGKSSYIINPEEKMAMKLAGEKNTLLGSSFPFMHFAVQPNWLGWMKEHEKHPYYNFKEIGSEKIRGVKCKVMEVVDKNTDRKMHYYVSDKNVIQRWIHFPSKSSPGKTTMDLLDYSINKGVDKDKLALPSGYQVQDMSQMMPNIPR